MKPRSKSTLFLAEQLIVIAVFALCAAACISILVTSYLMADNSNDTANALIAAQNYAETFKAAGGDAAETAALLSGNGFTLAPVYNSDSSCSITAYFDTEWQPVSENGDAALMSEAVYKLILTSSVSYHPGDIAFFEGDVTVSKVVSEEELVRLPLAVRN